MKAPITKGTYKENGYNKSGSCNVHLLLTTLKNCTNRPKRLAQNLWMEDAYEFSSTPCPPENILTYKLMAST